MPIISATDNENNRWKRNAKKNKDRKEQGGEAIVKGWEPDDFVRLSPINM